MRKTKYIMTSRLLAALLIIVLLAWLLKPPYLLVSPGETKATTLMLEYSEETKTEQLFYTTILLSEANWWGVLRASFHPHQALVAKQQLLNGLTLQEYSARSRLIMHHSLYEALEAAYYYLDIPYSKQEAAIYVTRQQDSSRSSFFEADRIKAIVIGNQQITIATTAQLLEQINRLANEVTKSFTVIVDTNGVERHVQLEVPVEQVFPIDELQLTKLLQIGQLVKVEEARAEELDKQILFPSIHVGGPSAGLIMALSIIDFLDDKTIQTPYRVAATGTILKNGEIGEIGSLEQKVVTVDAAQIDLFLVPAEQLELAQKKAESLHSAVTIVGVSTLQEAIEAINSYNATK